MDNGELPSDMPHELFCRDAITGRDNGLGCTRGAERCNYNAQYAYMINVYDVPIDLIPVIMKKHNTLVMDVWMFLPNILIDPKSKHDENFYQCQIVRPNCLIGNKKTSVRFDLYDSSTIYEHDYDTWKAYATTTAIDYLEGSIFVEHVKTIHTFTCIRFTDTLSIMKRPIMSRLFNCCIKPYYHRALRLYGTEDMTAVPDIISHFRIGGHKDIWHYKHIVNSTFVNDAYSYANRQTDVSFNYANFSSYLDSKSSTVFYQNQGRLQLLYEMIKMPPDEKIRLYMNLYIILYIKRGLRMSEVGNAIKNMQTTFLVNAYKGDKACLPQI